MAGGEYVSVSSQRDIEKTVMAKETAELRDFPDEELEELTGIYTEKGCPVALLVRWLWNSPPTTRCVPMPRPS